MVTDRELVHQLGSVGRAFFGRFDSLRDVQREARDRAGGTAGTLGRETAVNIEW